MGYTPGPWFQNPANKEQIIELCGIQIIANVPSAASGLYNKEAPANACLIAAAPELLEALQDCATLLRRLCPRIPYDGPRSEEERNEYETIGGTFSHAERIIAKATGAS